jgi:Glycine zipper
MFIFRSLIMRKKKKKVVEEEIKPEEVESGERLSGEPDSNLAAVGAGAIAGAATGAAVGGAIGGPVGAAIGAAAGAVTGGTAGDQIQNILDPKLEEVYWQENYKHRPYYKQGDKYDTYLPAYRFGWEAASRRDYGAKNFEELEPELKNRWETEHPNSGDWNFVRDIVRDAFIRIREKREQFGFKDVTP